jgi:lipoprotein-releasing system permease protein
MSPVIESIAMVQFRPQQYGELITQPIRLIGVDPATKSLTGEFARHLRNPENRDNPAQCFTLRGEAEARYRRNYLPLHPPDAPLVEPGLPRPPAAATPDGPPPPDTPVAPAEEVRIYGAVVGYGLATVRNPEAKAGDAEKDIPILKPGDEIRITMVSRMELEGHEGTRGQPRPVLATFVVTDVFKCDMAEIDAHTIYVDLHDLQRLRTMTNRATAIQLKLRDYSRDSQEVLDTLRGQFHPALYLVQTWEGKQITLLSAIAVERGILNILLFLIIAVAGFGILAIFFMIVVEKTRDIGILKSLGASNWGVMGIFLGYGLLLGCVGAGLGTLLGVTITVNINEIEKGIALLTGQDVFPRDVYYFDKIPTDLTALMVVLVNLGAVSIAVGASVLPSFRAALLHPVRALRYE